MLTLLQKAEEIRSQRSQDNRSENEKQLFKLQEQLPLIRESFLQEFADEVRDMNEAGISYDVKITTYRNDNCTFFIEFRHGKEMCGMPYQIIGREPSWKLAESREFRQWPKEDFILFITEKLF